MKLCTKTGARSVKCDAHVKTLVPIKTLLCSTIHDGGAPGKV